LIDDDPRLLLGGEHGLALFPVGCQWLRCYPSIARQLRQPRSRVCGKWRKSMGVEPTRDCWQPLPDLKSGRPTGTRHSSSLLVADFGQSVLRVV